VELYPPASPLILYLKGSLRTHLVGLEKFYNSWKDITLIHSVAVEILRVSDQLPLFLSWGGKRRSLPFPSVCPPLVLVWRGEGRRDLHLHFTPLNSEYTPIHGLSPAHGSHRGAILYPWVWCAGSTRAPLCLQGPFPLYPILTTPTSLIPSLPSLPTPPLPPPPPHPTPQCLARVRVVAVRRQRQPSLCLAVPRLACSSLWGAWPAS
jgi:hypothetical protein